MPEEENIEKQIISEIDKVYVDQPDFVLCGMSEMKEPSEEELNILKEYICSRGINEFDPKVDLTSQYMPVLYHDEKFLLGKIALPEEEYDFRGLSPHGLLIQDFNKYTFNNSQEARELRNWYISSDGKEILGFITDINGLRIFMFNGEKEWLDGKDLPIKQFSAFIILGRKCIEIRTRKKSEELERTNMAYW